MRIRFIIVLTRRTTNISETMCMHRQNMRKKQIGHFNFKEKEKRLLVPYERLGTNPQPRGVT